MSLLMQALKKAERAKQSATADTEVDKPSQEFDAVLALTPATPAPAPVPEPRRDTGLDFAAAPAFSLEPLPQPHPAPAPAPASELPPLTPPSVASPPLAAEPARPAPVPAPEVEKLEPLEKKVVQADKTETTAEAKPRSAARAAAAPSAPAAATIDPERLRLIVLLGILALIVLGFGYYYWQAVMAPGAGSRLPPVAMPPPGATGATPLQVIAPAGATANGAAPAEVFGQAGDDGSAGGMLAPSSSSTLNRAAREDIERRLARTEQELAAAQQAIQAQLSAPRQERLPPVAAADNSDIRVARAVQPARVTPALDAGYQALGSGDLANAQTHYEAALRQEPNSRDALLGMAAVATRQQQGAQASAWYLRLLELDPNDATAVAGLVSVRGGDIGQNERRLKAILTTSPEAAPALFALGNLYAQQSRWSEAQQTYFRAYSAAPDNPDYAYNLAIGLDRLNQGKLALTYYQRALTLAQDKAAAFDRNALRQRMQELSPAGTAH